MPSKLIELSDNTLVEIDVPEVQAKQISGSVADRVDSTLERLKPLLIKFCRPFGEAWQELNKDFHVEEAEIDFGLSFEAEGNLYVTKSKAGANLNVKFKLRPRA
jgi:Trypsin-co-occurring domain 1